MLSKERIQEVILANIFQRSTPDAADKIAKELQLAPGSVVLGDNPKVIAVTEDQTTRYVQIAPDGRSIVFVDPVALQKFRNESN
jgi:hypothetical protein